LHIVTVAGATTVKVVIIVNTSNMLFSGWDLCTPVVTHLTVTDPVAVFGEKTFGWTATERTTHLVLTR
jgi:hypothetical protein